jgi:outer membrane beta-barrel protein
VAGWIGAGAQELEPQPDQEQLIEPQVERPEVTVPEINTDDLELGVVFGLHNIEQFGTNLIAGVRFAYHITADAFIELGVASATVSDERYRRFGLPIFGEEEERLLRYDVSAAYSFLPGEVFVSEDRAMRSTFFVIGGVGATDFADEEQFTFNIGLGARVLPAEDFAVRVEMRDYLFESDLLGENELTHNLELVGGMSYLF